MVLDLGVSLTGDGMWVLQLEIGGESGQDIGLGRENGGELESRVSLERWASEHGRQTLAETRLGTRWR